MVDEESQGDSDSGGVMGMDIMEYGCGVTGDRHYSGGYVSMMAVVVVLILWQRQLCCNNGDSCGSYNGDSRTGKL